MLRYKNYGVKQNKNMNLHPGSVLDKYSPPPPSTHTHTHTHPRIMHILSADRCFIYIWFRNNTKQDCFLQKEARVCVSNAFVLDDSMFK